MKIKNYTKSPPRLPINLDDECQQSDTLLHFEKMVGSEPISSEFRLVLDSLVEDARNTQTLFSLLPANLFYMNEHAYYPLVSAALKDVLHGRVDENNFELDLDPQTLSELKYNNNYVMNNPGNHIFVERDYAKNEYYFSIKRRVENDFGKVIGLVGAAIPFTETQHLIQKLEGTMSEQASLIEQKDAFIQSVFHDIRGPLTGIFSLVQSLKAKNVQCVESDIAELDSCLHHYLFLIDNILLAKDKGFENEHKVCSLFKLLSNCVDVFKLNAKVKNLELRLVTDLDEDGWYSLPEVAIRRVLLNLIANAIKFTKYGYVWLNASVKDTEDGCVLYCSVEDTGIGINQSEIANIFKRYHRSNNLPGQYSGSGLGLNICSEIVSTLNGKIDVNSTPGLGSEFSISLPIKAAERPEIETDQVQASTAESFIASALRIIMVDDDPIALHGMNLMIDNGFPESEITRVENYQALLSCLNEHNFDLFFLDIGLPDVSGPSYIKEVRALAGESAFITVVSGQFNTSIEKSCVKFGADLVEPKPLRPETINRIKSKFKLKQKSF